MTYTLTIDELKVPNQRRLYLWSVFEKDGAWVASGDTYYKWNAKRAAKRAATRHSTGGDVILSSHSEEFTV